MSRIPVTARAVALITTLLVSSTGSPAGAQGYVPPKRFEITPFGSYQWGGSFDTQAGNNRLAGVLSEKSSFSWGAILSFLAAGNSPACHGTRSSSGYIVRF
jgi:hypothetical protein